MFDEIQGLDGELAAGVASALRRELAREHQAARINQRKNVAQMARDERSSVEGMGQCKANIDPTSYHYWGQRLGYKCWSDRKFIKEYLRDNPESRVKHKSDKIQVGYGSQRPIGYYDTPVGRVTFRKVYGKNSRVEVDASP